MLKRSPDPTPSVHLAAVLPYLFHTLPLPILQPHGCQWAKHTATSGITVSLPGHSSPRQVHGSYSTWAPHLNNWPPVYNAHFLSPFTALFLLNTYHHVTPYLFLYIFMLLLLTAPHRNIISKEKKEHKLHEGRCFCLFGLLPESQPNT